MDRAALSARTELQREGQDWDQDAWGSSKRHSLSRTVAINVFPLHKAVWQLNKAEGQFPISNLTAAIWSLKWSNLSCF